MCVFLFRRSNEANTIRRWTVRLNLMWMCFYSSHLFFTYSLVEKRGSWDKNSKAMNDEPTEKKIAVYIFSVISACLSNCSKREKGFRFFQHLFFSILLFCFLDTRYIRRSVVAAHKSKTHKKPPLFDRSNVAVNGAGRYSQGSMIFAIFETFTWLMLPIALMFIFIRTHSMYQQQQQRGKNKKKTIENICSI